MGQHQWKSPANALESLVFLLWCQHAIAANWAQVSGTKYTNAAVREMTPWTSRHGHAVAALDFSDDYVRSTGQKARLFVLGGDSNVQGAQDLRAYPGGGAMRNDVWSTTGPTWNLQTSILKTTKWGDPLPQIVANVTWLQTNNGKRPPRGVSHSDWIACASAAWAVHPPSGCDDPTINKPPGAYLADNMFSPRRNFVALAFQNELFVFGGRAREHFPVPQSRLRGGTGPDSLAPHNVRWLEFAVLKNDVWRSSDAGSSWKLVTPGCAYPQSALVHKASRPELQCEDDDECEGDASCKVDEATATGFCVCNMWSPREFHAVAVFNDALFLSGGYALIELGNCGVEENARKRPSGEEFACGGGYRAYLNDIWTSTDGQHWKMLKLHSEFSPRGEHSMVVFNSLLYILGGRTGASQTKGGVAQTELLNDVWVSGNGSTWSRVAKPAPWPPRAKHVTLVLPGAPDQTSGDDPDEQLIVMFGEDAERTLEDVWVWKGGDTSWIKDYSSDTAFSEYVRPTSDVSYLRTMVDSDALALGVAGINTIQDLTTLSFDQTIALRKLMPICDYISLARLVVEQCTVQPVEYEGQEYANVKVIQGANGDAEAAETTTISQDETNWDGCTHIGTKVIDATTGRLRWADVLGVDQVQVLRDVFVDAQESICQWRPKPRSGHAGVVFKRNVLVLGGLTAPDYYNNDVWYRDSRRPLAQFTLMPPSGSSDSVFKFESDKPYCLFEYSLLDTAEQLVVRNWTVTLGEVDYSSWLDSGTFRMRIRARDPAGNVDATFEDGRNEYTWVYVRPLPWGLIIGLSSVGFVLLAGFLMEWRKRRKRAAMERYAMKRMRRKLKKKNAAVAIAKEGDPNWRETYDDAKEGKKGKKGKKSSAKRKPTTSKDKKVKKSKDKTKEKKSKTKAKSGDDKKKKKTKDGTKKAKTLDTKGKTKTKDASAKKKKTKDGTKTEKRASKSGKKDKSDKKKPGDKPKGDKKPKTDKKVDKKKTK